MVSLLQDSINGQVNLRSMGCHQYFLDELLRLSDLQTEAFITSNGVNRYAAYRIDMQAFWIATLFAAISIFSEFPRSPSELALKAIGF